MAAIIIAELKETCNNVNKLVKMITARKEQEDKDEKEFQVSMR